MVMLRLKLEQLVMTRTRRTSGAVSDPYRSQSVSFVPDAGQLRAGQGRRRAAT